MRNQEISSALDWRYAVKKYDSSRAISPEDWATLETSLLKAPSAYGLQPFKFLVIEDPALRAQLREASYNQSQVTDASKFVVFLSRTRIDSKDVDSYMDAIAATRGIPKSDLKGFQDMVLGFVNGLSDTDALVWARRQTYIALGFLIETAALLGVDATPMEGFDPKAYDRILGLENSGWTTSVVAAAGYRHAEDATQAFKKVRRNKGDIVQYR